MKEYTFCAVCLFGLEKLVANELHFMGAKNVRAENGRVLFGGGWDIMARANIRCRYAERIQLLLGEFTAITFDELFNRISELKLEVFIGRDEAFPVKGSCLDSQLMSMTDCQKIIKKSAAKRLGEYYKTDWLPETGAVHQLQFHVRKDVFSVLLDTSGPGLHKRGYRAEANEAPIKETLAAAMVELSKVRKDHFVVDPMCGSGTILIEAAMSAMKIAPGVSRSFAAQQWDCVPKSVWDTERQSAKALENRDCAFRAVGSDIDPKSLAIAESNARKAGVSDRISFCLRDVDDFSPDADRGTLITNPPYGERMLSIAESEKLYKTMGSRFIRKPGWSYAVITPDDDFEKCFGRPADRRRKLYNGMLKCQLYMFYL